MIGMMLSSDYNAGSVISAVVDAMDSKHTDVPALSIPQPKPKKNRSKLRLYDCDIEMTFSIPVRTRIAAVNKDEASSILKKYCNDVMQQDGFKHLDSVFTADKKKLSLVGTRAGNVAFVSEVPIDVGSLVE